MCATVTPPTPRSSATSTKAAIIRARWISATPPRPPPRSTSPGAGRRRSTPGWAPPRAREAMVATGPLVALALLAGALALAMPPASLLVRCLLLDLRTSGDRDLRALVHFGPVLTDHFRRHQQRPLTEVPVRRE